MEQGTYREDWGGVFQRGLIQHCPWGEFTPNRGDNKGRLFSRKRLFSPERRRGD